MIFGLIVHRTLANIHLLSLLTLNNNRYRSELNNRLKTGGQFNAENAGQFGAKRDGQLQRNFHIMAI